jgi:hypothetical protein
MTETKFTPGPWDVSENAWTDYLGHVHTERFIVTKYDHPQLKRPATIVSMWVGLPNKNDDPSREYIGIDSANARLIAAAPELLEALELLVSFACSRCDWTACSGSQYVEHCPHVENAKQLIAKVKGGPNE